MKELSNRQKGLLEVVISSHIKTGKAVGSEVVARHYHGNLSPATVRNEMHELTDLKLLAQPHHSAGRTPTDQGYRYYVEHLMTEQDVAPHVASIVAREYRTPWDNLEVLVERTARLLSDLSVQAGFIMTPDFESLRLKRIELARLSTRRLLVVWVAENGFVENRVMETCHKVPDEELSSVVSLLNQELNGFLFSGLLTQILQRIQTCRDSSRTHLAFAREIVEDAFPKQVHRKVVLDGSRHVFDQPEFREVERSRRLFKAFDRPERFADFLDEDQENEGVRIRIGVENADADVHDCSFVTTRYQVNNRTYGGLGVVGPKRMPYGEIVSLVDYVARRFGETIARW